MREVTFCFSPTLFYSPLFLLYTRLLGRPGRANKENMSELMRGSHDLALIPGGFEEATLTSGGQAERVFIRERRGFVKYCLQYGYAICPCFSFGEKQLYSNVQGWWKLRLALNKFGVPAIFPWGQRLLPLAPKPSPLHVVVGAPLVLERVEQPTVEQVAAAHEEYVSALSRLFERHKARAYGDEARGLTLEVW
eukprot:CAMPEP_0183341838 /NCGR_PEP_ID=MMETSP0164_2-20130417/8046_1 /TAXON_ID=221442 /ORGANISM="Coccolithus pelagicus ssp braarudi, Strain PLY182g" /LENGTH=192 /DNA_ID=CAMNT_0025512265 /DNA_START=404 /DNA_END=979 /DNA_ORIENTATION=-